MSKLGRMWDWLLPGLISLSQMGAFAYYIAGDEIDMPRYEPKRVERRALVVCADAQDRTQVSLRRPHAAP